jgi:UDP-glucose 4-epimerase
MALRHLLNGGKSIALNLGTGACHSVREVIEAAREATKCDIKVKTAPRRPGDPPVLVANSELALRTLGWSAKKDLPEMVSSAWRWMQKCSADSALAL